MSPDGRFYAIHCTIRPELEFMDAAIIVVEPACESGWRDMVIPDLYGGGTFQVRPPIELTEKGGRSKGYNVRLPIHSFEQP